MFFMNLNAQKIRKRNTTTKLSWEQMNASKTEAVELVKHWSDFQGKKHKKIIQNHSL
jgi:hypothetical protein